MQSKVSIILAFVLSFTLAFILGVVVEMTAPQLYYHAQQIHQGKPLSPVSEWSFQYFAGWRNGNLLCIFILPWALLLLYSLLSPRVGSSIDRGVRLLYGFICFAISEAILFLFFGLSSLLPFIPNYSIISDHVPVGAYIPHVLLLIIFVSVITTVFIRGLRWRNKREGTAP